MARKAVLAVLACLVGTTAAFAHHPFAEFDRTRPVTLTGRVTLVEWQSPHVYAYLDVKDAEGRIFNWKVEMGSPDALDKEGWNQMSVKPGDHVTIKGWRGKTNRTLAYADSFTLPGGNAIAAAASSYDRPSRSARNQPRDPGRVGTTGRVGTSGVLPATASPVTLIGVIGALSLAGALGAAFFRQASAAMTSGSSESASGRPGATTRRAAS
jgi:hypothetical protein